VLCALVMAALFGMTGVWLAFCAAEAITAGVMAVAMKKTDKSKCGQNEFDEKEFL